MIQSRATANGRNLDGTHCVMAAFMKHGLRESCLTLKFVINGNVGISCTRQLTKSNRVKPRPIPPPIRRSKFNHDTKLQATEKSIAAKGFLRPLKEYNPPANTIERLNAICASIMGSNTSSSTQIGDPETRFKLFNTLFQEFQHGIPNSLLHCIQTLGDVQEFYKTPVNSTVPLDAMKSVELPPNLHIQYEYHRFHPEADTMFGGISAFPKSSTVVSGLKYKKKYTGYKAKTSWP